MIEPGIWHDRGILRISLPARLLFIGLVTLGDDGGCGDADSFALKAAIFPADSVSVDEVDQMVNELVEAALVEIITSDDGRRYYSLPAWDTYQRLRPDLQKDLTISAKVAKIKHNRNRTVTELLQNRDEPDTTSKISKISKKRSAGPSGAKVDELVKTPATNPAIDLVVGAIREKINRSFGVMPEEKPTYRTAQALLTRCREADIDPIDVVAVWNPKVRKTPLAILNAVKKNMDGYADRVGGWGNFVERLGRPSRRAHGQPVDITEVTADILKGFQRE